METNNEQLQPIGRLGKLPAKSSRKALHFGDLVKAKAVDVLPKATNFWRKRKPFPLRTFGNTEFGNCTRAKQAVAAMRMERLETKRTPEITDEEVIRVYREMSDRLYGGGDNGAYETDALSCWRNPEYTFRDTKGNPLTIEAYLRVNHTDVNEIKRALWLQPSHQLAVCFNLPLAWSKIRPPQIWDIPVGQPLIGEWMPGSWGGHSMDAVDWDEKGLWVAHTWGIPNQLISWNAVAGFCDETHWFVDSLDNWRKNTGVPRRVSEAIKEAVNSVSEMKIK